MLPFAIPEDQQAFVDRLLDVGARRYHDRHSFHEAMNAGRLGREDLRIWALNRFYYQRTIPMKDAAILANLPVLEIRQRWIQRILNHDGAGPGEGGIDAWLSLVESVGGTREEAWDETKVLPGVRFSVDAYLNFCRQKPWIEAVASSLTELFAQRLHKVRLDAFLEHYPWVDESGLRYFRARLDELNTDVEHGLSLVLEHCVTEAAQDRAVAALEFKCELLWAQLDAIQAACGGRAG